MIYIVNNTKINIKEKAIPCSQGGTSTYVAGFINYLIGKRIEFGLIGFFNNDTENDEYIYPISSSSNAGFIVLLLKLFLQKKFSANDILYFQRPDHLLTALFAKGKKVIHLHGQQRTTIKYRRGILTRFIYNIMESYAMRNVYKIIVTDQHTATLYLKYYPYLKTKIIIIPTGIDVDFFKPENKEAAILHIPDNAKKLVYIGRLGYPKRIDQIIKAFNLAFHTESFLRLLITGSGHDEGRLKQMVNEYGLDSCITFTGELSKYNILKLIQTADAAILLSYCEGSPISIKECLACGKPAIVNDVGDVTDYIIPHKTGEIVNADSLQEIATAILSVVKNSISMKENCREVSMAYDENVINNRIYKYIENTSR